MKAPGFWDRPPGVAARMLGPLAAVWTAVARGRQARARPVRAAVPVLCVGNPVAGGAGKTPVVLDLLARARTAGIDAHAVSRGHGGRLEGPVSVDPSRHTAAEVGDEPLLLAREAPTWIARDRAAGAGAAAAAGAELLILDDGFQNPGLAKDLSLLVIDGTAGLGNGRVIPAGPLREPLADGLRRAGAVVVLGRDRAGVAQALAVTGVPLPPVLAAELVPDPEIVATLAGRRVLAFAGIGRPGKFFDTLRALGADVVETAAFPDHHRFRDGELARLLARAEALRALPVTTAKDRVRLPAAIRDRVTMLPVRVRWADPQALDRLAAPLFDGVADGQA